MLKIDDKEVGICESIEITKDDIQYSLDKLNKLCNRYVVIDYLKYTGKSTILCPDCGELAHWNSYFGRYLCTKYYENHTLKQNKEATIW